MSRWFRLNSLKLPRGQRIKLALKWEGFEIPPELPEEDDVKTDAIFFITGSEKGICLDTMLFYPLSAGGCRRIFLSEDDIKYIVTTDNKVKKWEDGWMVKY